MRMIFYSALINHPLHNALDEHAQHHQQQLFTIHASSPPAVKGGHQSTPQRFDKRQMGVQLSWKLEQYDGASTLFDINSMMSHTYRVLSGLKSWLCLHNDVASTFHPRHAAPRRPLVIYTNRPLRY